MNDDEPIRSLANVLHFVILSNYDHSVHALICFDNLVGMVILCCNFVRRLDKTCF